MKDHTGFKNLCGLKINIFFMIFSDVIRYDKVHFLK